MKNFKQFIKTTIREFLNENMGNTPLKNVNDIKKPSQKYYKGYDIEQDRTGYAPKEFRFSFFLDDGETYVGSGESIEDCMNQIDDLIDDL